jgi:hypothetical protein
MRLCLALSMRRSIYGSLILIRSLRLCLTLSLSLSLSLSISPSLSLSRSRSRSLTKSKSFVCRPFASKLTSYRTVYLSVLPGRIRSLLRKRHADLSDAVLVPNAPLLERLAGKDGKGDWLAGHTQYNPYP